MIFILLFWLTLSILLGVLVGKMIKLADRHGIRLPQGGVVARAFAEATREEPAPVPDPFAPMDEHIRLLGHDEVLKWLDPSIRADFPSAEEIEAQRSLKLQAEAKKRQAAAREKANRDFAAKQKDAAEFSRRTEAARKGVDRRQIVVDGPITAEIMQFGQEKPVRVIRTREIEAKPTFTYDQLKAELNYIEKGIRDLELQAARWR